MARSRALSLLPASCCPPHPPAAALGSRGAPAAGEGRGGGERVERTAAEAAARAPARARASPRLRRRAGEQEPRGRSERWAERGVGGRARAGGRVASPPASAAAAFARSPGTDPPQIAWRTDAGARLCSWPASARLPGAADGFLSGSRPRRLGRPRRAGSGGAGTAFRRSVPAQFSPGRRRGPQRRPRVPAPRRAAPSNGAQGLQTRAAGASVFMNPEDVREALQGS